MKIKRDRYLVKVYGTSVRVYPIHRILLERVTSTIYKRYEYRYDNGWIHIENSPELIVCDDVEELFKLQRHHNGYESIAEKDPSNVAVDEKIIEYYEKAYHERLEKFREEYEKDHSIGTEIFLDFFTSACVKLLRSSMGDEVINNMMTFEESRVLVKFD